MALNLDWSQGDWGLWTCPGLPGVALYQEPQSRIVHVLNKTEGDDRYKTIVTVPICTAVKMALFVWACLPRNPDPDEIAHAYFRLVTASRSRSSPSVTTGLGRITA